MLYRISRGLAVRVLVNEVNTPLRTNTHDVAENPGNNYVMKLPLRLICYRQSERFTGHRAFYSDNCHRIQELRMLLSGEVSGHEL